MGDGEDYGGREIMDTTRDLRIAIKNFDFDCVGKDCSPCKLCGEGQDWYSGVGMCCPERVLAFVKLLPLSAHPWDCKCEVHV